MPIPTWTNGQILTASDVNSWFVPVYTYKTASTSRATNTTLTADPHLVAAMAANAMYDLSGLLDYEADVTGDFKFQFTLPASATMNWAYTGWSPSDTFFNNAGNAVATVGNVGGGGAGSANSRGVNIFGSIVTSSTAGNLGINWAQQVSSGTATILHQYSYLKLVRVG